ncbi:CLIP-associating protein isoform X3 [Bradysia coprophila]|uniref:CLIP-associating protein isoform X3 n=1 Tax=Bradysia coprophila TaxID=38358 RepID=UPI00187DBE15|nr:CLIP-associating protein isoform X3 [Bradysia coprophila]
MAYHKPQNIDDFVLLMAKADMRVKAQLAEDLVAYLSDMENSIVSNDLGLLVDNLMPWLIGSHFKIAQRALEAFTELIGRLGQDFSAYTPTVLPQVVDRLGDSRETVREKAQLLLFKLMESRVLLPQQLLDKLIYCFKHKNSKIREEFLQTIVSTLNEYGTQSLSVKAYIQPIVSLLGDPTSTVRDAAIQTLVEIYKHVGDKLRIDLRKKDIHPTKMAALEHKFDEVRQDGLLLPSALRSAMEPDETDTPSAAKPRIMKRTPATLPCPKKLTLDIATPGDAGAVTWEVFEASFEVVPQLTIFSPKDIEDNLKAMNVIIGNKNMDWEKRVDALRKIRSLLIMDQAIFSTYFKDLSIAFLDILKELRSQVIREACITIAFMSKTLKSKLDGFCVYIVQELINLVPNSVKVIASAGSIALKFVIKYTHAPKLIPIITQNLIQSKSKDIRSNLCEILGLLFDDWAPRSMEKYLPNLKESLIKGIADADSDARKYSRRNFWSFKRHFPDAGDQIYSNLDPSVQRALDRERDTATNGTERRLSSGLRSPATANPSASTSTENLLMTGKLQRAPSLPRTYNRNRSGIPVANREPPVRAGFRSISAVDTAAVQRARARAQYSNMARMKVTAGTASLQGQMAQQARAKKLVNNVATPQQASPEHRSVSRRTSGVSQSQPASRSTSPSSRSQYSTYSGYRQTGTIPKKSSGIPRSVSNSRETSPTRTPMGSIKRLPYQTSSPRRDRPPINPTRPVLAQKILQASREAENALADALSPDDFDPSSEMGRLNLNRKVSRDESDESEASSVCSERSFDSYRRNDSGSWNGSRNKLDSQRLIEDIDTIIVYCSSTHWGERKDGLTSLTTYLSDGNILTPDQLQTVLDLFRKMFMDSHTKVYALFLDSVNELILSHSNDLHDWLFILLTRLFNKLGTELLGSMHGKIWKTLQLVHEYFPPDLQMHASFRIICDAAQTPSTKTKIAQLKFLTDLATTYCTATEFPTQSPADKAITKIVQMAVDQKSLELRNQARSCIISLYNCSTPNMTAFLSGMPKNFQDTAKTIIQQHLRRSTSGNNSPSSPLTSQSPKLLLSPNQGPLSLQNYSSQRSRQSSVESQPMNTEEVYRNLRKTTAEIQNYSFETKLDRDSNSKDSGISQMCDQQADHLSLVTGLNGHMLMKKDDSCNGSKSQSATTTESNTPENTVRLDTIDANHKTLTSQKYVANFVVSQTGELIFDGDLEESEIVKTATMLSLDSPTDATLQVLNNLGDCIRHGNCELPIKHFKAIMKALLILVDSPQHEIVIAVIKVLAKIMRSEPMKLTWLNFLELLLLKIIDCYKMSKETSREIDFILPRIANHLPFEPTFNILYSIIGTGEYPTNLCAIKLLTELVDAKGTGITDKQLDSIMSVLALRTDENQSMVRKAAVFCIVRLYVRLGEERVRPKFSLLNSSKIRLLDVYIAKYQQQSLKQSS